MNNQDLEAIRGVRDPFVDFMNALPNHDTVKVILTGVGETQFTTKEIYEAVRHKIDHLIAENEQLQAEKRRSYIQIKRLREQKEELQAERDAAVEDMTLIAGQSDSVLTCNSGDLNEALDKIAEYAKAKAAGRLVILPCKVDDTVYVIPSDVNFRLNVANGLNQNNRVYEQVVESIHFYKNGVFLLITCGGISSCHSEFYKTNWFLTREEAEAALKQIGGKE